MPAPRLESALRDLPADIEGARTQLALVLDAMLDEVVPTLAQVDRPAAMALGRLLGVLVHTLRLELPVGETASDCALVPDACDGTPVAVWRLQINRGTPAYHRASPALTDTQVRRLIDALWTANREGDDAEARAFFEHLPMNHAVWVIETAAEVGLTRDKAAMLFVLSIRRLNVLFR